MAVYQIPQKTLREDRIIGPLTIRDLLVLCGTAIVGYFTFSDANKNPFLLFSGEELVFLAVTILITGAAWTFIKIDEKPLEVWLVYVIHFFKVPKVSLWQKSEHEESIFATDALIVESTSDGVVATPQQATHEIGRKFDAISKLLDAPDGVVTTKETEAVMGMLGEDDAIVAMKETIQQENKDRTVVEQQNASKARLENVIGEAITDKKQSTMSQSQILARPERGVRGFFQQTSRLFVSNVLDAFQVHAPTKETSSSPQASTTLSPSAGQTSSANVSLPSQSEKNTAPSSGTEGVSSSPDQLLEELRKKSSLTDGVQQSGQQQTKGIEKSSERVKIVSDAALND